MRRRLPPLKTLPAFEIAADRLSFSEAAGELHLTHGAVSRQIKTLETALGVPLFRRRNRRIELTEAGLALLPGVREALQLLEACTVAVAAAGRAGGVLRRDLHDALAHSAAL
jgi:LysR family transcriptional regulator, glycine cleavage system transcriptional activator